MKILLSTLIFTVLVSIFAYICLGNQAVNAGWVQHVNPVGVVLGFAVAFQGVMQSKKYVGLMGLTQLSFWPLYGFFIGISSKVILQILLTTIITLYLGATLFFFGMIYYDLHWSKKPQNP
jgi:hypothetical protein